MVNHVHGSSRKEGPRVRQVRRITEDGFVPTRGITWDDWNNRKRTFTEINGENRRVLAPLGVMSSPSSPSPPIPVIVEDVDNHPDLSIHSIPCQILTEDGTREARVKNCFETTITNEKHEGGN